MGNWLGVRAFLLWYLLQRILCLDSLAKGVDAVLKELRECWLQVLPVQYGRAEDGGLVLQVVPLDIFDMRAVLQQCIDRLQYHNAVLSHHSNITLPYYRNIQIQI